jgi:Flp pilus assembly protein TadG
MDYMKSEKGQAAVELGLIVPIILFLICGIFDFGRILYTASTINILGQEAARYVSLESSTDRRTTAEVKQFVIDKAIVENKELINVTVTPSEGTRKSGDYVKIDITYSLTYITPFMNDILPSPFPIDNETTIRVE